MDNIEDNLLKNLNKKYEFLDKHVFYGLTNLNDGFDGPTIKYFNETEFEIVLNRVKDLGIEISGIEPWKDGMVYDVITCEFEGIGQDDREWYFKAFENFKKEDTMWAEELSH